MICSSRKEQSAAAALPHSACGSVCTSVPEEAVTNPNLGSDRQL